MLTRHTVPAMLAVMDDSGATDPWRPSCASGARLRPAVGERFIARARIVKPGKTQVFAACELYAEQQGAEKLVATGETLLVVSAANEG